MTPRIVPYLYVDDVTSYLRFLTEAFGFETRVHEVDPDDPEHVHAQAALGEALVMVGHATAKWGTTSPRRLAARPSAIYAVVDDVDAHCRRARAGGATVEAAPADMEWGDRMYTARDPEGHQWYFATPRSARGAA